jgi:uncharacterized membrane protein
MRRSTGILLSSFLFFSLILLPVTAKAKPEVVRAVLFYSETCPACHDVMERVLPPLVEKYTGQLDIVGIDVMHPVGENLYQGMLADFDVSDDRIGVPTLIVGSTVLVGTGEIEQNLASIIETGLAAGGIDWPELNGLAQILTAQEGAGSKISTVSTVSNNPTANGNPGFLDRFNQDPLANSIAVIVLAVMLLAGTSVVISYLRGPEHKFLSFPVWLLPLLAVIGLGVAFYLSYVEISNVDAVCGPVGNCNSVQNSSYSKLFGVIPVGVMGAAGYIGILMSWVLSNYGPLQYRRLFTLAIWGMAWFGLLFSIYLTFLEPFVIGATCAWCITSALVMTLVLLVSTGPAKEALKIEEEFEDDEDFEVEEGSLSEGV